MYFNEIDNDENNISVKLSKLREFKKEFRWLNIEYNFIY